MRFFRSSQMRSQGGPTPRRRIVVGHALLEHGEEDSRRNSGRITGCFFFFSGTSDICWSHRMRAEMKGELLSRITTKDGQGFIASGRFPPNIMSLVCEYLSTRRQIGGLHLREDVRHDERSLRESTPIGERRSHPLDCRTAIVIVKKSWNAGRASASWAKAGTGSLALLRSIPRNLPISRHEHVRDGTDRPRGAESGGITIHDFMGLGIYPKSESDLDIYAAVGMPDGDMRVKERAERAGAQRSSSMTYPWSCGNSGIPNLPAMLPTTQGRAVRRIADRVLWRFLAAASRSEQQRILSSKLHSVLLRISDVEARIRRPLSG